MQNIKLIIVSGRSGSGKSAALDLLEDLGFYCIDGIPVALLPSLLDHLNKEHRRIAISIDARNLPDDSGTLVPFLTELQHKVASCELIFLKADDATLLKRFSQTRRKHPLSNNLTSLNEAMSKEETLLKPLMDKANFLVETDRLSVHALRGKIREYVDDNKRSHVTLLFQSFGFKFGLPLNADYVFDVRCLPNPYWQPELRPFTGLDAVVQTFLSAQPETPQMIDSIQQFLQQWLPRFEASHHAYLTIAIGCTGGQHRSVYVSEQLAAYFQKQYQHTQIRHREIIETADKKHSHQDLLDKNT